MHLKIAPWYLPQRYIIVAMVFVGYINFYCLHTNIGMAVVQMTSAKKIIHQNGTLETTAPEYNWNSKERALVLSSFAYGRFFGPIGGAFAGRIGGSTLYSIGTLLTALITILTPFFLSLNFYLFVFTTALTGTFESFSYASVSQLWSRWIPPNERAKCISISIIGIYGGSIVSFIVAGWILDVWGWTMLFYVSGTASLLWFLIWRAVVKDDPSEDKHVSDKERKYIAEKLNNPSHTAKLSYPWKDILTCMPFWAGCLGKFCNGTGYTFTMMYLPQYIKDTNDIDIRKIGYISVIPQLGAAISMPLGGCLLDYIRSRAILSLTNTHKLYIGTGLCFGIVGFTVAGLLPNFLVCIVCLTAFQCFSTFAILDIQVLVLDLAPRYAAFMNSVANSIYTTASFLTPALVGLYVTSHSQLEWNVCFFTISVVFLIAICFVFKFVSGDLQPWANYKIHPPQKTNSSNHFP